MEFCRPFKNIRMLSVVDHVFFAASIAIFAVCVTQATHDWQASDFPVEGAASCTGQVVPARINNARPSLRGC
jgi:hypothetical protein